MIRFRNISWRLTNTLKHFDYMGVLGWFVFLFAYFGKAEGLGFFPVVAAFMVVMWVEYRQFSLSKLPFKRWAYCSMFDSTVDVVAGMAGFVIMYHGMLYLFVGNWIV